MYLKNSAFALVCVYLVACSGQEQVTTVEKRDFKVSDVAALDQHFETLNTDLNQQFKAFKAKEFMAFPDQSEFDAHDLSQLSHHPVSQTALKQTKQDYCKMMNEYFATMYQIGHQNLDLMGQSQAFAKIRSQVLASKFDTPEHFYHFIIDEYTTYKFVQLNMNYGCNLKAAL